MSGQTPVGELEGRALDAAVAEEVMGQERCEGWKRNSRGELAKYCDHDSGECMAYGAVQVMGVLAHYSTDMAAAWEVVEHANVEVALWRYNEDEVFCDWGRPFLRHAVSAEGRSAPEAISRAALKAVRSDG